MAASPINHRCLLEERQHLRAKQWLSQVAEIFDKQKYTIQ